MNNRDILNAIRFCDEFYEDGIMEILAAIVAKLPDDSIEADCLITAFLEIKRRTEKSETPFQSESRGEFDAQARHENKS